MAMCCTWIISRSPRDHDLLNLSSPLALHQKKNTEKLRTFFFQNRTDRTSAPCGAGRWAVPSCLACFKSNSRTLTFGILIAPIRFSEVKMVPELSVRLLKGVMSGTCGGIKVSNSLTAQLRWTSRSFNQNSRSAVFLLDAFHRLEFRLRGLPKIWEQRTAARRPRSTPTMFSAHHAHGFSKQTQRIKFHHSYQRLPKSNATLLQVVDWGLFFHRCDCLGTKRAGFDSAVLRI